MRRREVKETERGGVRGKITGYRQTERVSERRTL